MKTRNQIPGVDRSGRCPVAVGGWHGTAQPSGISSTPQAPSNLLPAYGHLNLVCNPFGEIPTDERAALVVADLDRLACAVAQPGFALQVLGDSGRGKTSFLLALAARFPHTPYVRVDPGGRANLPRTKLLFVDEVQALPRRRRRRLFARRQRSLVLGSHDDFSGELRAAGFEVRTHRPAEGRTVEQLEEIFRRRIERARRGPGPVPTVPRRTVEHLMQIAGDNIRAMEGMLYDAVQSAREATHVEV